MQDRCSSARAPEIPSDLALLIHHLFYEASLQKAGSWASPQAGCEDTTLLSENFLKNYLLDIFFIFISNVSPFQVSTSETPYPIPPPPASMRVCPHPLPSSCPDIPLHWGIEHPQTQEPLLPLMSNKAILCHICSWSHGSFHVYSLVGGPVPEISWGSGLLTLFLPPWGTEEVRLREPNNPIKNVEQS